jgi:NAD(P)H dehydrogenase (quinone)
MGRQSASMDKSKGDLLVKPYILILYYTRDGSTLKLANYIGRGVEMQGTFEARYRTVAEVVCVDAEEKGPLKESQDSLATQIVTMTDLENCAGLAVGSPTRFGQSPAAMRHFWDRTTSLWLSGTLVGRPAAAFSSTGSLHGGQETSLLNTMVPLLHHGMLILGLPYIEPALMRTQSGGTPYGATHVSGTEGDRAVDNDEKTLCLALGRRLGEVASIMTTSKLNTDIAR